MVTALFKEGQKAATTTSLQKYDYGEVLRIKGLSLPRYVAVQFAVDGMSEALPSSIGETVEDVTDVLIPNSLLRSNIKPWNYNIMAYVYIVSGSSGKTEYTITIPVKWRPKTGDDQAADDDVAAVIGSAVEKMNTATTKAENAANHATETAEEIKADREKITTNEIKIAGLKLDIDNFRFYESNGFFKFISNWHNGDVDSVGEFVDSKSTRRSDKVEASLLKCVEIITHNHNGCSVREWDINGRYLGSSWVTSSESIESRTNTFDFKSDTAYIAFTITGSNNYNANENNVDIKIFIEDYFLNDKSLQKALKIKKGFVSPVTDFGAYGNGLHNDTEALQNCIKFCIENSVPLKCEKAYQFMITNTLEFIGIDNSYTTGESENIVRTFKTINAEFDFNGSTILAYGNFAESSHTALYEGEEIPSVLYIKSTNLYDMHFEIKNLFIDVRKINCVCVYADELKKSTFRNITIKHLAKIGIYIENNCGGIMFYDTQMIANKKKAIGFWNASSDCYFDGIYMVDVTYGMILSASYCNIKKFHPFILTPSFVLGSVMFKLLSRNASGKYVGESTIILDQCYADTYNIVFDVSSHIGHRIISTGMTYINNTQILNNLFGKDTPSKMICVFTMKNKGYANKIKLSSNYMSGYKKEDKVYTYLCDSEGDESLIDDMSVISNVNYNNGELIN